MSSALCRGSTQHVEQHVYNTGEADMIETVATYPISKLKPRVAKRLRELASTDGQAAADTFDDLLVEQATEDKEFSTFWMDLEAFDEVEFDGENIVFVKYTKGVHR